MTSKELESNSNYLREGFISNAKGSLGEEMVDQQGKRDSRTGETLKSVIEDKHKSGVGTS